MPIGNTVSVSFGSITAFFIGPFLMWSPLVVGTLLLFFAAYRYVSERGGTPLSGFFSRCSYKLLARVMIGFHVAYALLSTFGQYLVWKSSTFTSSFLQFPVGDKVASPIAQAFPFLFKGPLGYFLFYSWGHFWFVAILSVAMGFCLRLYLRALEKRNDRFFHPGEVDLGFLCTLVLGWPRAVLFFPVLFLCVLFVSLFRTLVTKASYTTFGYPFLLSAVLTVPLWNLLQAALRLYQLAP